MAAIRIGDGDENLKFEIAPLKSCGVALFISPPLVLRGRVRVGVF
jgi:hypothetical protein